MRTITTKNVRTGSGLNEDIQEQIDDAVLMLKKQMDAEESAEQLYRKSPSIRNGAMREQAREELSSATEHLMVLVRDKWENEWRERITRDDLRGLLSDSMRRIGLENVDLLQQTMKWF